jgi:hypothetical protein
MRNLQMHGVHEDEAWNWFRGILNGLPEVPREEGARPGIHLSQTLDQLRRGNEPVDIASYGDSVGFDVGNLPLDLALERGFPGAVARMHTRGQGSGGWETLGQPELLQERIIDLQPDLLICLGVSTAPDCMAPALEPMLKRVRAAGNTEIMLLTNHRGIGPEQEQTRSERDWDGCAEAIRDLARRNECELVDFRKVIKTMLQRNRPPADRLRWYMRDPSCHLNDRGRGVALTLMARHLGLDQVRDL